MKIKKLKLGSLMYPLLVLILSITLLAIPAFGQEAGTENIKQDNQKTDVQANNLLDDVVVKASKMDRKPEHMTDSVTIINEAQIELQGFTDATEILRLTPSVEFKQAGGPGQFSYPKMRGYPQGHYLVLINGMRVNEPMSAGVGNFIGHIDTELVESVEVLRGPQSALYGSDTTAGVMSFSTLSGKEGMHSKVGVEYGSLDWKKGFASVRGRNGLVDYAVAAAYTDSDGVHDEEFYKNFSPTFKLGWHPGAWDVEVGYLYVHSEFQSADLDYPSNFLNDRSEAWAFQTPDPNNANEYDQHIATLNVTHTINDAFRQKMMVGLFDKDSYRNDLDDGLLGYQAAPFDNFTYGGVTYNKGDSVPVYDDGTGVAYGYDNTNFMLDYNFIWDSQLSEGNNNTALFGVAYEYQKGGKWGRYGDMSSSVYNFSLYANDQFMALDERLILSGGVRLDEHEAFGSEATWKIGSAYTIPGIETTLFSNYGTSFRAPSFSQLYDPSYGSDSLTPETGWTVEAGVRKEFLNGRIDGDITFWYSELDDVIVFDYTVVNPRRSSGFGEYNNRDSMETSGVEFAFGADITDSLNLSGNYTYTDSTSFEDGIEYRTVQIARNKGSLTLSCGKESYNMGVSAYYSGPRLRWKGDVEMKEYWRFDIFGNYKFANGMSLYTRVENILDKEIEEGLGYEQPGVYAIVGLKFEI